MAHDPASVCVRACVSPYMKKEGGRVPGLSARERKRAGRTGDEKGQRYSDPRDREREKGKGYTKLRDVGERGRGTGHQGTGTSAVEANL